MTIPSAPHRLLVGSFPALERALFLEIADRKRSDPLAPVEVLVGSNLLAVHLRRAYAERFGAVANIRFLTFLDLARERLGEPDPRPALPALGDVRLARRALAETPEASAFQALRDRASLASALVRTARDLFDAGLAVEDFRRVMPESAATPDRREFLDAVAATLQRFGTLRASFVDPDALLERSFREGRSRTAEPLAVYGVYDLGGRREALLSRVANERRVVAFVPDAVGSFDVPGEELVRRPLFERLLGVPGETVDEEPSDVETRIVEALDETSEAREVVREILDAVTGGTPLHRIGVLLRRPEEQEPALLAELRRLGIPFFRPPGPCFAISPAGRAATALMELDTKFDRAVVSELLDLVESLGLFPSHGLAGVSPSALSTTLESLGSGDEAALRRRIASERTRLAKPLATGDDPEGTFSGRRRRRAKRLEELERALSVVAVDPAPTTWVGWSARLTRSFTTLLGKHPDAPRLAEAASLVGELERVEPGRAISRAEVLELLPEALDLPPLRFGRFERDGVSILSVVSARGLMFDVTLVPGLVERSFPALPRPDPLLFDDERRRIREATGRPITTRAGARSLEEERFLFHLAATSARSRLVLLAARRDTGQDRDRLLSPFLEERRPGANVRRLPVGRVVAHGPALDDEEVMRRAFERSPDLAPALEARCKPLALSRSRGLARASSRYSAYEGLVGRAPTSFDLGVSRPISPSRLERFASCPYKAFLADVLELRPPRDDETEFEASKKDVGLLVHAALRDHVRTRESAELIAERLVNAWSEESGLDRPPVFLERMREVVARLVKDAVAHDRQRGEEDAEVFAEVRFGPTSQDPDERDEDPEKSRDESPTLTSDGRTFRFSGRIDRLDLLGGRARVVDYKISRPDPFGKANTKKRLIAGGERLQLALYALAARQLGARDVEGEYLFLQPEDVLSGKGPTAHAFDARQMETAVESLRRFLSLAARMVAEGAFLPRTETLRAKEHCRFCDFAAICAPGHLAVYARKRAGDPATARLLAEIERIP